MRQLQAACDRQRRHDIGGCYDGAEQETNIPRQSYKVMRRRRDGAGGKDHAADRQQHDRAQVRAKLTPAHGDARRIDQRRQHHQQYQFRRQLQCRHARHESQHDAGEEQQYRWSDMDAPRQQSDARQDGEQDQENLEFGFHSIAPFDASRCAEAPRRQWLGELRDAGRHCFGSKRIALDTSNPACDVVHKAWRGLLIQGGWC